MAKKKRFIRRLKIRKRIFYCFEIKIHIKVNQWVFFFKILKVKMKSKTKIHKFHAALDTFISRSSITRNWKMFSYSFLIILFLLILGIEIFCYFTLFIRIEHINEKINSVVKGSFNYDVPSTVSKISDEKFPFYLKCHRDSDPPALKLGIISDRSLIQSH